MDITKLRDALREIESQQVVLHEAADGIRRVIAMLSEERFEVTRNESISGSAQDGRSYIDEAVDVLDRQGRELHIKKICELISASRGEQVKRQAIESSMIRHIAKAKHPKLAKFGPSTYGLPKWKSSQPTLVELAEAS